jgi:hypothetical protein
MVYDLECKCIRKYFESSKRVSSAVADLLGGTLSPKLPSICKLFCLPHEKEISNKAGHTFDLKKYI